MKMTIPEPGTVFTLTQAWTFPLYHERRNVDLYDKLAEAGVIPARQDANDKYRWWSEYEPEPAQEPGESNQDYERRKWETVRQLKKTEVTLPKGTRLRVDRVYIKGASDYNSLTFRVVAHPKLDLKTKPKSPRFWAKLYDVNNINCTFVEETVPR